MKEQKNRHNFGIRTNIIDIIESADQADQFTAYFNDLTRERGEMTSYMKYRVLMETLNELEGYIIDNVSWDSYSYRILKKTIKTWISIKRKDMD